MIEFKFTAPNGPGTLTVLKDRISGVGTEGVAGGYSRFFVLVEGQRYYTTGEESARVGRLLA